MSIDLADFFLKELNEGHDDLDASADWISAMALASIANRMEMLSEGLTDIYLMLADIKSNLL